MNFKIKLLVAAVLPVALISLAAIWIIQNETQRLAETQIATIEQRTLDNRRAEIRKMSELALSSLRGLYEDTALPEKVAKERARARLTDMAFGQDGYFFVYDETGTNIVHPRLTNLVGQNLWNMQDPNGDYVIRNLIKVAKNGGGFHSYIWNKPSTGKYARKISHAVYLEKWGWMIGTGLYVDDLETDLAVMRKSLSASIASTTKVLLVLSTAAVLLAALIVWFIRLSEQRFADTRLKNLTHRIVEVQEDERKRVSTELHDGISQLLVSARYGLDQALAKAGIGSPAGPAIGKSMSTIDGAIAEVRRISMALRPSVLDDIGLAAALSSLGRDFGEQTGLVVNAKTERTAQSIPANARTALYRVAQEALTNIAKHADATCVNITLKHHHNNVILSIEDDGELKTRPTANHPASPGVNLNGMGLRNMQERIEAFNGVLEMTGSTLGGLKVEARIPIENTSELSQGDMRTKRATHAAPSA